MSDNVAKRSAIVEAMVADSAKMRALMGGTKAMREAGEEYLPKFEAESVESYASRLKLSWLFNGYRKTVKDMSGKVFSKPVEIAKGPSRLTDWSANVDMQGNDLSVFAKDVFEDGYDAGISFVWVDAPPRDGVVTQAQAEAGNLRPYFVHLSVEQVLGWKSETVNNITTLTQFRIMEMITVPNPDDEFADDKVEQVRVLDRTDSGVQTRLYRKVKDTWTLYEEPTTSQMAEITVVPFYANRTGFMVGSPVLDDLADVNIAHWQSQSDQRSALRFARVAVFHRAGADDDERLVIAPGMSINSTDPSAKAEWVEHSGQAIGAGRQDLKDLEFQMETHGLQLLVAKPGGQSATGEVMDAAKETSTLSMTADQLQDTLERALGWMSVYGGLSGEISVSVNKDYGVNMLGAQEVTAMLTAVNTGNMSRETFLREMVRRGMIASDTNVDDEVERIETEGGGIDDSLTDAA